MVPEPQGPKTALSNLWAVREVDHLIGRLTRYTKFVVYSKWGLASVAVLLMVSLIAWPLVTKDQSGIRVSFNGGKVSSPASSPVMTNPEFRGSNAKGDQYRLNGIKATQRTPTLIELEQVEAQMVKKAGGWIGLTADRGELRQDNKMIELFGNVTVINDKGYNFVTSHATIDTNTMNAYGNEEVNGVGPSGNLLASGFEIKDKGSEIMFKGSGKQRQHLTIDRKQQK